MRIQYEKELCTTLYLYLLEYRDLEECIVPVRIMLIVFYAIEIII